MHYYIYYTNQNGGFVKHIENQRESNTFLFEWILLKQKEGASEFRIKTNNQHAQSFAVNGTNKYWEYNTILASLEVFEALEGVDVTNEYISPVTNKICLPNDIVGAYVTNLVLKDKCSGWDLVEAILFPAYGYILARSWWRIFPKRAKTVFWLSFVSTLIYCLVVIPPLVVMILEYLH